MLGTKLPSEWEHLGPLTGIGEGRWEVRWEAVVLILVVDKEIQFIGAMRLRGGRSHAGNNLWVILVVCWCNDSGSVHYDDC